MFTITLAPTAEMAAGINAEISIEAEYGTTVIEGSLYTAAHHGSRNNRPAPCVDSSIPTKRDASILVSHIDLDTVGGVARVIGHGIVKRESFWTLAAFVDVNGPHKLAQAGASNRDIADLYAYWAWSQANRGPRLDPKTVHDVTDTVGTHIEVLHDIFGEAEDGSLHQAGKAFRDAETKMNEDSYVETISGYIIRVASTFVNHLYVTPDGTVGTAVVALNPKMGSITLSLAEASDDRSACEIMQTVFGPTAGGHKGIAGSPRGKRVQYEDILYVIHRATGGHPLQCMSCRNALQ